MGNHRAPRRASRDDLPETPYVGNRRRIDPATEAIPSAPVSSPGSAGKRRAVKHAGRRGPLFRALPSAPVLVGIAALAISTGGVVTAANPGLVGTVSHQSVNVVAANALNGVSGTSRNSQLAERREAVSRDSTRAEAAEAAGEEKVNEAEAKAEQRAAALAKVSKQADQQEKKIELNQWTLPVTNYSISATFGQSSGLWSNNHTGLDFNTNSGAPIYAVANGTITETGYDGAYGNKTVLTLDDGTELWFAHQTSFTVSVGDVVRSGDLIGYVGSTGNTTGAHLHLEVRPGGGDPVDPYAALIANHVQP
jgi:biotin carboxyl carrier protein